MYVKARFEMWLEDNSPDAGKGTYEEPDLSSYCRVGDKVLAACEAEKGIVETVTILKSTTSIAEIREEYVRRHFLDQMPVSAAQQ